MTRLTERDEKGYWKLKEIGWRQLSAGQTLTKKAEQKLYGALCKLRDYEDTGLEPYEVKGTKKENVWIPVSERVPDSDDYILVSFENFTIPSIGRYEVDKDGNGAFYPGDEEKSYVSFGVFVNAWMPLPEPYKIEI